MFSSVCKPFRRELLESLTGKAEFTDGCPPELASSQYWIPRGMRPTSGSRAWCDRHHRTEANTIETNIGLIDLGSCIFASRFIPIVTQSNKQEWIQVQPIMFLAGNQPQQGYYGLRVKQDFVWADLLLSILKTRILYFRRCFWSWSCHEVARPPSRRMS